MSEKLKRLLILSCSARKSDEETAPALQRYRSPAFFVVRRYLKTNPDDRMVVWILSAKYGLISSHRLTVNYDQAMTPERAGLLAGKIFDQFNNLRWTHFGRIAPASVFCHLPKNYLDCMARQLEILGEDSRIEIAAGRPGEKSRQLKLWLEEGR